jgi:uncharacterized membrane protein
MRLQKSEMPPNQNAVASEPGSAPTTLRESGRVPSLDILRGAVMVLMALDHVRVFSGVPAGGPTPGVFFTRWITHFCAPAFLFLAGTAIFLYGQKLGGRGQRGRLARFLLVRGAWLILLEMTFIRFGWTFNFDYAHYALAGVIWVIGWCMILMAGLVFLPVAAVGTLGAAILAGHDLMDGRFWQLADTLNDRGMAWLWKILYFGFASGPIDVLGARLTVLYSLIPWIGVMAVGYAFGPIMRMDAERRRRWCLLIGGGAIVLFLALRGFDLYGDPNPWRPAPDAGSSQTQAGAPRPTMPPALRLLNTNKYPASLLFLLMTLGPMILAIPLLETAHGAVARILMVYGRVPFFYYVLHIPLIHLAACAVSLVREGRVNPWLLANHPMGNPPPPDGYAWSLPLLYFVTAAVVAALYLPCRWMGDLKQRRSDAWLRYV